jgi:Cof subfamily protein (haloacid dehalogenase superfamily)
MIKKLPFEGILLVSDMDGTLITDEFKLPERNIKAIDRFIKNGGSFTLATGRSAESAFKYLGRIKTSAPAILSNGTVIYDFEAKKLVWNAYLPKSAEEMFAMLLRKFPDVGGEIYREDQIYIVRATTFTQRHIVNEGFKYTVTDVENVPHGWQKVLFTGEYSQLSQIEEFVGTLNHDGCNFVFSSPMFFEALPEGVSKGTTLLRLANMLNIKHENTIGIGDYFNDLTLVSMAGFGAAVSGAPKELIDLAKFVTGTCESGAVADLIEYIEKFPEVINNYSISS